MSLVYFLLPLLTQPLNAQPLAEQSGAEVDAAELAGAPPECAEPRTQQAMNYCAALEWEEADAELNKQWRETAAEMRRLDRDAAPDDGRTGYFDQLLSGQRAWLIYRDHRCASEGYLARGGSMEPLLVATCKADLTRTRTAQLRELADWPN